MGDNFNEGQPDEKPVHEVYLDTYYISKYEVTFEQYDYFCEETGRKKPSDQDWGRNERPVITVTWYDAKEFCDWLSEKLGEDIHLPTEAQWEKAARGTDQRRFPWGNSDPDSTRANYGRNENKTMPVGSYPAGKSFYGVHDMAGNVWEFCQDWYDPDYYKYSPRNNPQGPSSGSERVTRGGDWWSKAYGLRSALRNYMSPSAIGTKNGFRICKEK
jgi:formylglycine-generating enzyme required for sulfatase activity